MKNNLNHDNAYKDTINKGFWFRKTNSGELTEKIKKLSEISKLSSMKSIYEDILKTEISVSEKTKKIHIGYFCNMVPEEFLIAMDIDYTRLCSSDPESSRSGEEILPVDVCPLAKSCAGDFLSEMYNKYDLIIMPRTCDTKAKLGEILSFSRDIYLMDIPHDNDYLVNADNWEKKFVELLDYLVKRYNRKINSQNLLNACKITNERTKAYRDLCDIRGRMPDAISSYDFFFLAYTSFFTPCEKWTQNTRSVINEILGKKYINSGKKSILLAGSPIVFPNFKILDIISELDSVVSADTLCSSYGRLFDPVVINEETFSEIIRSLSLKYVSASMCPCFTGITKQADSIIELVNKYNINGVIYNNLRLCQVFEMSHPILKIILKEKNIPLLFLKTDLYAEDTGQLKTRIEAFLEMLR
jgi:benzoyl-CoA reductase/2-hydroxyglutaryl-CoA dehydratase subunit BcrC/BadD/HgdB